jgi:hypothetical protein
MELNVRVAVAVEPGVIDSELGLAVITTTGFRSAVKVIGVPVTGA